METVQRAGKGKWKGDLRSELEMRSYARRRSALVIWTDCCMFTFCKVIVEHDNKRGLEVGGSDGGAARLDNGLLGRQTGSVRGVRLGFAHVTLPGTGPRDQSS